MKVLVPIYSSPSKMQAELFPLLMVFVSSNSNNHGDGLIMYRDVKLQNDTGLGCEWPIFVSGTDSGEWIGLVSWWVRLSATEIQAFPLADRRLEIS